LEDRLAEASVILEARQCEVGIAQNRAVVVVGRGGLEQVGEELGGERHAAGEREWGAGG